MLDTERRVWQTGVVFSEMPVLTNEDLMSGEILLTAEQIQQRVKELGAQITEDYWGKFPIVTSVLQGSSIFASDLVRNIGTPVQIDNLQTRGGYENGDTYVGARIVKDFDHDPRGRHVLVVEDIYDTGLTLNKVVLPHCRKKQPASLRTCCFLDKPARHDLGVSFEDSVNYVGVQIPDKFVVGYGLDYLGVGRNLPCIVVLTPEIAEYVRVMVEMYAQGGVAVG